MRTLRDCPPPMAIIYQPKPLTPRTRTILSPVAGAPSIRHSRSPPAHRRSCWARWSTKWRLSGRSERSLRRRERGITRSHDATEGSAFWVTALLATHVFFSDLQRVNLPEHAVPDLSAPSKSLPLTKLQQVACEWKWRNLPRWPFVHRSSPFAGPKCSLNIPKPSLLGPAMSGCAEVSEEELYRVPTHRAAGQRAGGEGE